MTAISFRRRYRLEWRQPDGAWKPAGPGFAHLVRAVERVRDLERLGRVVVNRETGRVVLAPLGGFGWHMWQPFYARGGFSRRPVA